MNEALPISVALSSLVGAVIGYIGAIFTFRSRFETMQVKHDALADKVRSDRESDQRSLQIQVGYFNETLRRIERQSVATLQLVANIAHKQGVDKRNLGEDVLADFLRDRERDTDK